MKYTIFSMALSALVLAGCAGEPDPHPAGSGKAPDASVSVQASQRPSAADLEVTVEGEMETVPATLYAQEGYSMYIPNEGWVLRGDTEDGILREIWESTANDEVELMVCHYEDMSSMVARDRFVRDCGYVFADGLGGELGAPLYGTDDDGDVLEFMVAEGLNGTTAVIAWEYPAEAAEGFGVRLAAMANTFELED